MSLPPIPAEAAVAPGETVLGQWDFPLVLRQAPVARIVARFLLTNERLIVLHFPTPRAAASLVGRLGLGPTASGFRQEMGRWHLMLNARLADLPEPRVGPVDYGHPTALPSNLALILGTKNFPVGEGVAAEAMGTRVREQWAAARRSSAAPFS